MKQKQFIIILLATLMLFGCASGTNQERSSTEELSESSSNSSGVTNSIPFEEIVMPFENGENLRVIIKSSEELAQTLVENEWLTVTPQWINREVNRWEVFDAEFFVENALILHFMVINSTTPTYFLEDIEKTDEKLTLYIVGEYEGDAFNEAMGFVSFVVKVAQSDIENITNFVTDVKLRKLAEKLTLYSLEEAYNYDLLNKEDIKHIGFFVSDKIFALNTSTNEWEEIEFTPEFGRPTLSALDENTVSKIKFSFYEKNKEVIDNELALLKNNGYIAQDTTALDTVSLISFLGEYNRAFAAQITTSVLEYDLGSFEVIIDNISWSQFAPEVLIFK